MFLKEMFFCEKIVLACVTVMILSMFSSVDDVAFLGVYLVLLTFYTTIKLRDNIFTFIVSAFLLWFNYSIVCANYFLNLDAFFVSEAYDYEAFQSMVILITFILTLNLFLKDKPSLSLVDYSENHSMQIFGELDYRAPFIPVVFIIVLIFILVYGFERPDVAGERGSPSTIYEYSVIIFVVGFYFFRGILWYKIASSFLLFCFALQNMFFGGRITALQLLMVVFILFVHTERKVNYKKILPIIGLFFVIFMGIGMMRTSFSLSFETLKDVLIVSRGEALTLDTSYSAFFTSMTFLKAESIFQLDGRLHIFLNFLLSQFLGGSVPNSNLCLITREYFMHYYGGVLPVYWHFFLGYVGVFFIGILIAVYLNVVRTVGNCSHGVVKCAVVYFVVTTPRWYLYSPVPLIRGLTLLILFFLMTKLFVSIFKKLSYYEK